MSAISHHAALTKTNLFAGKTPENVPPLSSAAVLGAPGMDAPQLALGRQHPTYAKRGFCAVLGHASQPASSTL